MSLEPIEPEIPTRHIIRYDYRGQKRGKDWCPPFGKDMRRELLTKARGRMWKRIKLFDDGYTAPTNAEGFDYAEVDTRFYSKWMFQWINLGNQHLQITIQASNHPKEHIQGKAETYYPCGWIFLRKYFVLMWSTSYRYQYNMYRVGWFPHTHWKDGQYYGNLPNPYGDEFRHNSLPWGFVRLGVRHNSGSGGKFQAYFAGKS